MDDATLARIWRGLQALLDAIMQAERRLDFLALKLLVVVFVALAVGSLFFADVYRKGQRAARESAIRLAYFPLELESPLVYHVKKSLIRKVVDDKKPEVRTAEDTYFTRLTLTPVASQPGEKRARASRTEKCATLAMALQTVSSSKDEELYESQDGVRLAGPGLLLMPPLSPLAPVDFTLTFGLTRGPEGFFGWPLLEVIGMTEEERGLHVEPDVDRQSIFNVLKEETVRFYSAPGEDLTLGGAEVRTLKLEYRGHQTKKNVYHEIAGMLWLAPGIGVVKEQRQVILKVYPKETWNEKEQKFETLGRRVVVFEAEITKLLAHPLKKER
jgi:hypothetical protein